MSDTISKGTIKSTTEAQIAKVLVNAATETNSKNGIPKLLTQTLQMLRQLRYL